MAIEATRTHHPTHTSNRVDRSVLESAVLAYLSGTDLDTAARAAGVSRTDLSHTADRYRSAGAATLAVAPVGWLQVNIEFTNYVQAENAFRTDLWPSIRAGSWWFVRKAPCWRLRYLPTDGLPDRLRAVLDTMIEDGVLRRWDQAIYEPETAAFGGAEGIAVVHELHAADAAGLLTYVDAAANPAYDGPGRPVVSLMVLSHIMRAAGLEWAEQGDVWARVEAQRPEAPLSSAQVTDLAVKTSEPLRVDLQTLVRSDPRFSILSMWAAGMQAAGNRLAEVHRGGGLQIGLRAVLARSVTFCWNRAGFTADQQAVWAKAARLAILGLER